jgi:hypothetical protein
MFDLLQKEYGWTDDQILDLTLGRLKVALRVITDRRSEEQRARLLLAEAHARAIIGALPGLAWTRKASKSIADLAKSLSFIPKDERPAKPLPSAEKLEGMFRAR